MVFTWTRDYHVVALSIVPWLGGISRLQAVRHYSPNLGMFVSFSSHQCLFVGLLQLVFDAVPKSLASPIKWPAQKSITTKNDITADCVHSNYLKQNRCKMAEKASPSLAAVAVSSRILGLLAGYFLGQGSSIGLFNSSGNPNGVKKSWPNSYDVKVHADSSDEEADDEEEEEEEEEEEDEGDGKELSDFKGSTEEVKLVLAVRTDLGMGKGMSLHLQAPVGW
jgi:hypothetical protein